MGMTESATQIKDRRHFICSMVIILIHVSGELAEWSKAHAWKACNGATHSRVQIPCSPPHKTPDGCFERASVSAALTLPNFLFILPKAFLKGATCG